MKSNLFPLLSAVCSLILGQLAIGEPEVIKAQTSFHAVECARVLDLMLTPGEVTTTVPNFDAHPSELLVGTMKRVIRINWQTGKLIYDRQLEAPARSVSQVASSPWLGVTTHARTSHFTNLETGTVIDLNIPFPFFPYGKVGATKVKLHPNGKHALAVFDATQAPVVFIDLEKGNAAVIAHARYPTVVADARFIGKGAGVALTWNDGVSDRTRGLVLNTDSIDEQLPESFLSMPAMHATNGPPWIRASTYDPLFATTVIEGPSFFDAGIKTTRVNVYRWFGDRLDQPQELRPIYARISKGSYQKWPDRPHIPPLAFVRGERLLFGNRDGSIELHSIANYRMESPGSDFLMRFTDGHGGAPVSCVADSKDGRYFASGAENGTVAVWSLDEGKGFQVSGFGAPVKSLHFSAEDEPTLLIEVGERQKVQGVAPPSGFHTLAVPVR